MRVEQNGYTWTAVPDKKFTGEEGHKGIFQEVHFKVMRQNNILPSENREIGSFTFAPMPGNCGMVVSTNSQLNEGWRGIPVIGETFHKLKEQTARDFGYTIMIATVQLRNLPEVIGASKAGWKFDRFFRNKRTDNDIGIMYKELK